MFTVNDFKTMDDFEAVAKCCETKDGCEAKISVKVKD